MALEFEDQTPQSINDRMGADVKLSAPRSNPTRKNSWLFAFVKGLAFRVYDFYQQLGRLKRESFPDTSTWDGELKRWGGYKEINPIAKQGAKGVVIVTGNVGATLPKGATGTLGKVTYQTDNEATIAQIAYSLISLSRNGNTVTAKTSTPHRLATGLDVTISGADQSVFNGAFEIAVPNQTTFTYQVDSDQSFEQASGLISASFDLTFVNVSVSPISDVTGVQSNQSPGTTIPLERPYAGIDDNLRVAGSSLSGGVDSENPTNYQRRVIDSYQHPIALFNPAAIRQHIKQSVGTVTRVWVYPITPNIGQTTIYFTTDNTGVIPTGQDVDDVKKAVDDIAPSTMPLDDIFVFAPNPRYVDFEFSDLKPNTITMRQAIRDRLEEMFYLYAEVNQPLTAETYRAQIKNTIDVTGSIVEQFALSQPIGDINPGIGGIPILRNVTFTNTSGAVYMPNLFDGQQSNSDGTANGYSKTIAGSNQIVDIFVYGTFGTAVVALQEYGNVDKSWHDTSAVWTHSDKFQGLNLSAGQQYRLMIKNADSTTDILAEVYYG